MRAGAAGAPGWGAALRGAGRWVSALPACRQRPAVGEEKPRGHWESTVRDLNLLWATYYLCHLISLVNILTCEMEPCISNFISLL